MKHISTIVRTVLITVNVLFAVGMLWFYPAFGKADWGAARGVMRSLTESGALDTNALSRYVAENRHTFNFTAHPLEVMEERTTVTADIWHWFVIPSGVLLLLDVIVIGFLWKRPNHQEGRA